MKFVFYQKTFPFNLRVLFKMKAPTTTFRWYRISYFLKTLWLTTSSLVTCSKTPSILLPTPLKEPRKALLITWLASAVEMKHFTVFVAAEYTCPWFISMLKFQQGKKWYVKHLNLHRGRGGRERKKRGGGWGEHNQNNLSNWQTGRQGLWNYSLEFINC